LTLISIMLVRVFDMTWLSLSQIIIFNLQTKRFGTQPITRNRMGPPMIRCRGHGYRLVIAALV